MKNDKPTDTTAADKKNDYVTRESILKLLSENEVASVAKSETAAKLAQGDEYVDLKQIGKGVQFAKDGAIPMANLLPKKAVQEGTWGKIVKHMKDSSKDAPKAAHS